MSEQIPQTQETTKFNFFTSIWIVPLIAIMIALWLLFRYYSELGPKIEIIFQNNEGLKEGQSQIKYKDVPIGKVEKVFLNSDGRGVKVIARIEKEAVDYLNDKTQFWIVKPEVGFGGVSGLDTLLSGTYINLDGQKLKKSKAKFIGLDQPSRNLEDGAYYHLNAPSTYSVIVGTPIYYKSLKVGQVEYITISLDGESVDVIVYIDNPYTSYIHIDSKFWVQSSLSLDYLNGQFNLNVAPLANILHGGIEFSSSEKDSNASLPSDYIFKLHKDSTMVDYYKIGTGGKAMREYTMIFDRSAAKLKMNASVKFDGYDVGRVADIDYAYNKKTHQITATVAAVIDTSVFVDANDSTKSGEMNLENGVKEGLRASLQEHDPLSGYLYVNLDFIDTNETTSIVRQKDRAIFPTVDTPSSGVMSEMGGLLKKLKELPLDTLILSISDASENFAKLLSKNEKSTQQLLVNLNKTLEGVNRAVGSDEFANLPAELGRTMKELQKTLRSLDSVMHSNGDESLLSAQMGETLKELHKTSVDTQKLLQKLERKPNSVIFGE